MRTPLVVRTLTEDERAELEVGLHSSDGFVLRRCQIILASSRGQYAPGIGAAVGRDDEAVRDVIRAFNERGLECLVRRSNRPKHIKTAFDAAGMAALQALLHESPRKYDKPTSVWTLDLAAQVCFEQGLTAQLVSGETVRLVLARLGVGWRRAKHWITSPDPQYARKKSDETN